MTNLQYSSALLHSVFNTNDMYIMPSKIAQNIVSRCSTKLAIVNVGRPKTLLLCVFFHEERYKKTSLEKEEATLVSLVATATNNKKAGGLMAQLKECYYTTIL